MKIQITVSLEVRLELEEAQGLKTLQFTKFGKIIDILRFQFVFRKPKPKEDTSTNTRLNKRLIQKEKDSFLDGFDQRSSRREKKKNQNINYRESGKGKSKLTLEKRFIKVPFFSKKVDFTKFLRENHGRALWLNFGL